MVFIRKQLKKYTNEELYEILQKNENYEPDALALICSEVLRRYMTINVMGTNELF